VTPTGSLKADQIEIEEGQSVNLNWQVSNASSVTLDGSTVGPSGSKPVTPDRTTTYQLSANNGAVPIQSVKITVRPKVVVVQPPSSTPPKESKNEAPTLPDRATLESGLNAYTSLFARASGKSKKDCQAVFNGKYQGRLKDFADWCDDAKSYEVKEQCSQQVGGSPEAPTLTCTENITINLKNGDPQRSHPQKTFHFSKSSGGAWEVSGWQ
jgi:hypothetical protein